MRGLSLVVASGGHSSSQCAGLSCCRAQAPDAQAQQLWLTGPAALRHVGSSQTRARTRVPCIGRQILNHCATREARKKSNFDYIFRSIHDYPKGGGGFFFFFGLLWVFVACGLSLVAVSGGYSSLRCSGFSLQWLILAEHGL